MTDQFTGTIHLAGQSYPVRVERRNGRVVRFIGDETVEAFIARQSLLRRSPALEDATTIGKLVAGGSLTKPQATAWGLHRARERAN